MSGGGGPGILREAAATSAAAGLAAGAAGLAEGILLAVLYDPFGAPAATRLLSVALFVVLYAAAGIVAGALLALPVRLATTLSGARVETGAALACGSIGLLYAWAWIRTISADAWLSPVVQVSLGIWGFGLFYGAGRIARPLLARLRPAPGVAVVVLMAAGALAAAGAAPAAGPAPRAAAPGGRSPAAAPQGPTSSFDVILVLADTLRADHLSLYGYERATSPELSRFAASGVVFDNAIVAKTKTSPSVASIFTATWPHTHGIVTCRTLLREEAVTLAEVLRGQGFATHSIVANSNAGAIFGFGQGFDAVDEIWADPDAAGARGLTDHALAWIDRQDRKSPGRPFFLYLHYIDPHAPYAPPQPYASRFVDDPYAARQASISVGLGDDSVGSIRPSVRLPERTTDVGYYVSRYDGEIAYLDSQLGRLFDALRRRDPARRTLVIFTADHGEALSEHEVYFSHGEFGYEDNARVPLVMSLPGRIAAGRRVPRVVPVSGIAPTILAALAASVPPEMEVHGFWDLAAGGEPSGLSDPATFVEAGTVSEALRTAIRTARWKLIENPTGFDRRPGRWDAASILSMNRKQKGFELSRTGREHLARFELYDLETDPQERLNLDRARPDLVADLEARLRAWRALGQGRRRLEMTPVHDLPNEVIRNLRSLGYIN